MSEILVFGKGYIGAKLVDCLSADSTDSRISTYEDIQSQIDKYGPKVIVNAIGHYGRNVDDCEIDKTKTLQSHTVVPILMAEAAIRNNIKLVHISSGCIFNYDYKSVSPIDENQPPDFFDLYYSRTKIYTEAALSALGESANILQLRIRMPLDNEPHPKNLLTKLISFKSVIDFPNSVTYVPDFVHMVRHLIARDAEGIYNCVNYGGLKHRELLEEYRKHVPTHSYSVMDMADLKLVRTNLLLSTDKLEETGFPVRDIHDVLPECVEHYINLMKSNFVGQGRIPKVEVS